MKIRIRKYEYPYAPSKYVVQYKIIWWYNVTNELKGKFFQDGKTDCETLKEAEYRMKRFINLLDRSREWLAIGKTTVKEIERNFFYYNT